MNKLDPFYRYKWDIELKWVRNIQKFSSLIQISVSVVLNCFVLSSVWKNLWSERNLAQVFKLFCQSKDFIELHLAIHVTFQVSSSKHLRCHPMITKFCLAIAVKSPTAYEKIRLNQQKGSGILVVPSQRTLRDCRNYIRPQRRFNPEVVNKLNSKTQDFTDVECFIVLLLDEMKVEEDLVWDKNTGNLLFYILHVVYCVIHTFTFPFWKGF